MASGWVDNHPQAPGYRVEGFAVKYLKIEYNGIVLFDGDVEEVMWSESRDGVQVQGRVPGATPPAAQATGNGLLDLLMNSRRQAEVAQQPQAESSAPVVDLSSEANNFNEEKPASK